MSQSLALRSGERTASCGRSGRTGSGRHSPKVLRKLSTSPLRLLKKEKKEEEEELDECQSRRGAL